MPTQIPTYRAASISAQSDPARREVKAIAIACEDEQRAYKTTRPDIEKLTATANRLGGQLLKLRRLQGGALNADKPPSSVARSLRSVAVLGGASLTLPVSVPATVLGAAVDTAIATAAVPVAAAVGVCKGSVTGCAVGQDAGLLTAPVAFGSCTVLGAGFGLRAAGTESIAVPFAATSHGSIARKLHGVFNKLPPALAHVERKGMSTKKIAEVAEKNLTRLQDQVVRDLHEAIKAKQLEANR